MTGLLSHRSGVWLRNQTLSSGSASDIWADRVQSAEVVDTHNSTDYYELGRVAKIGVTTDPTDYRVTLQENLHNSEIDMYLAGVDPTSGSGYYAANIVTQTNRAYVVFRNDNDSVFEEIALAGCRVSEITYTFVVNGACTVDYTLMGTSGSYYHTAGTFVHPLWGAQDATSPGGVHGKEARIRLTTNADANRVYRLQRFVIRAQYPEQTVRELGNRQIVGKLVDSPNVTIEFDLQQGDLQPHDVFFPVTNDDGVAKRALGEPQTVDVFVDLYDPNQGEGSTIIKSFGIPNCKPSANTPVSARVRQLTTARWSLSNTSEDTIGTGGLIVSKTQVTTT
jgi:hypothetical protein